MTKSVGDDDLISLAEAANIFFNGRISKSSLRTEASKGNLEIIRIANKDFVTRNGIKRMIERCTVTAKPAAPTYADRSLVTPQEVLRVRLAEMRKKHSSS